ncbi:MAG: cystathionine beta-lyase [Candidatus Tokpelaia sp. JSC188]|nr:MAG: cystathionine beta-lyase [Candidatus Tokpelaia sp. JSC188]
MKNGKRSNGLNTYLVHDIYSSQHNYGFINPSIFRGSTVLFPDAETMEKKKQSYTYGTHGTPTTDALCHAINLLEGAAKTILVPSGLAAVTVALLSILRTGDHLLITDSVYYPTRRFANNMLKNMGIEVEYYAPKVGSNIEKLFRHNTRVVFAESPASNTFEVQDIPAISAAAHKINAVVMMDNSWATSLYFRPLKHGVDISIHAATKYPSGHSDVLLGTISTTKKYAQLIDNAHRFLGMNVNGDDAYLILRGLRTMCVRLEHQQKTALALAFWLEEQQQVSHVLYPALKGNPGYKLWKRDFSGAAAIFSVVLKTGGRHEANIFLNNLKLFGLGYSWGGFESLAIHVNLSDRTVSKANYPGPILRLQIGIEDFDDLKADLKHALAAINMM